MADITQTISNFPPAPDSGTDTPTEFNSKADAFVNHQSANYVNEVNTWAGQANSLKADMNQIKTDVDGIVATIPDGTIDDTALGTNKVYSNQKTQQLLDAKPDIDDTSADPASTYSSSKIDADFKIEQGSGYTKFPDGTLMCWGTALMNGTDTGEDTTYPHAFADATTPIVTIQVTNNASINVMNAKVISVLNTTFKACLIVSPDGGGAHTYSSSNQPYIAIGRWK